MSQNFKLKIESDEDVKVYIDHELESCYTTIPPGRHWVQAIPVDHPSLKVEKFIDVEETAEQETMTIKIEGGKNIENNAAADDSGYAYIRMPHEEHATVCKNGMYGLIDSSGNEVVPCVYGMAHMAGGYVSIKIDGKWGLLDKSGSQVFPCIYEEPVIVQQKHAIIKQNGKYGCTTLDRNVTIPCEYNRIYFLSDEVLAVKKWDKYDFMTVSGKTITSCKYKRAWNIAEEIMGVCNSEYKEGAVTPEGQVVPCEHIGIQVYGENIILADNEGPQMTVYHRSGREICRINVSRLETVLADFVIYENYDEKYGVLNRFGRPTLPDCYDYILVLGDKVIAAQKDNLWALYDEDGNQHTEHIYEYVKALNMDMVGALQGSRWTIFDKDFKPVGEVECFDLEMFDEKSALLLTKEAQFEIADFSKGTSVPIRYTTVMDFSCGYIAVIYDDRFGIINISGNEILPCEYDWISMEKNGAAFARKDDKWILLNLADPTNPVAQSDSWVRFGSDLYRVEKDGKFGLIDRNGNEVVPCIYAVIEELFDGIAKVKTQECCNWDILNYGL